MFFIPLINCAFKFVNALGLGKHFQSCARRFNLNFTLVSFELEIIFLLRFIFLNVLIYFVLINKLELWQLKLFKLHQPWYFGYGSELQFFVLLLEIILNPALKGCFQVSIIHIVQLFVKLPSNFQIFFILAALGIKIVL